MPAPAYRYPSPRSGYGIIRDAQRQQARQRQQRQEFRALNDPDPLRRQNAAGMLGVELPEQRAAEQFHRADQRAMQVEARAIEQAQAAEEKARAASIKEQQREAARQQKAQAKELFNAEKNRREAQYTSEDRPTYVDAEGMIQPKHTDQQWAGVKKSEAAAKKATEDLAIQKRGIDATEQAISEVDSQFTLRGRELRAAAATMRRAAAQAKSSLDPNADALKAEANAAQKAADDASFQELEWERNKLGNKSIVKSAETLNEAGKGKVKDLKEGLLPADTNLVQTPALPQPAPDVPGTADTANERSGQSATPQKLGAGDLRAAEAAAEPKPEPTLDEQFKSHEAEIEKFNAAQQSAIKPLNDVVAGIQARGVAEPLVQLPDGTTGFHPSVTDEEKQMLRIAHEATQKQRPALEAQAKELQSRSDQLQARSQEETAKFKAARDAEMSRMRSIPGMASTVDGIAKLDADFESVVSKLDPKNSEEDKVALQAIQDRYVQERDAAVRSGFENTQKIRDALNTERLKIKQAATEESRALASVGSGDGMVTDESAGDAFKEIGERSRQAQIDAGVKLGLSAQESANMVDDLVKIQDDWQGVQGVKDADKARILSTGDLVVNPAFFIDPEKYKQAVESSSASPEAKASAMAKLPAVEEAAMTLLWRNLAGAPGFHEFALKNGAEFLDPGVVNLATWTPQEIEDAKANSKFKTPAELVRAYQAGPGKNWFRNQAHQMLTGSVAGAAGMIQQAAGAYGAITGNEGAIQTALDASKLSQRIAGQSAAMQHGQWTNKLTSGAVQMLPAMLGGSVLPSPLAMAGTSGAAGVQSLGGTFTEAVEANIANGMTMQQAHKAALGPSIASGLTTAAITFGFGPSGVESMFAKDQFKQAGVALIKNIAVQSGMEFTEEGLDQAMQGIIASLTYDPSRTFQDIVKESLESGALGTILGGGTTAVTNFDRPLQPSANGDIDGDLAQEQPPSSPTPPALTNPPQVSPLQQTADLAGSDAEISRLQQSDPALATQVATLRRIASGAPLERMTDAQLESVGVTRNAKGEIVNVKPKQGEPAPAVKIENGQPIITQPALDALEQAAPRTRNLVQMDETEARQRISQQQTESLPPSDASSGAEVTGEPRGSSTQAVAAPADSGAGLVSEGAAEASLANAAPATKSEKSNLDTLLDEDTAHKQASASVSDAEGNTDRAATRQKMEEAAAKEGLTYDEYADKLAAANVARAKKLAAELKDGDTFEMLDGNGRPQIWRVETDLNGEKKFRDMTEGSPAQDFLYPVGPNQVSELSRNKKDGTLKRSKTKASGELITDAAPATDQPEWLQSTIDEAGARLAPKHGTKAEELFAQRKTAKEVAKELGIDEEDARALRAFLKIPPWTNATTQGGGLVENPEFTEWLKQRNAATATPNQPSSEPQQQDSWSVGKSPTGGVVFSPDAPASQPAQTEQSPERSVMELAAPLVQAVERTAGKNKAAGLAGRAKLLSEVVKQAAKDFAGVRFVTAPPGVGPAALAPDGVLEIDVAGILPTMAAKSVKDARAWVESMIDEEFKHRVALDLENNSPEFAQNLEELYSALPDGVKEMSRAAYFAQVDKDGQKNQFEDERHARHEFFRQYWQSAKLQKATESALTQKGLIGKLRDLVASFLKELRRIQKGAANPQVKAIADRLLAQAEAKVKELRGEDAKPEMFTKSVSSTSDKPAVKDSSTAQKEPSTQSTTEQSYEATKSQREAKGGTTAEWKPVRDDEPPVPAGHVRFYHGGVPGDGSRWVAAQRDYAEGYARKTQGAVVKYVDIPVDHPSLRRVYDDSGTPNSSPFAAFDASAEIMKGAKVLGKSVSPAPVTELPSYDGPPLEGQPIEEPNPQADRLNAPPSNDPDEELIRQLSDHLIDVEPTPEELAALEEFLAMGKPEPEITPEQPAGPQQTSLKKAVVDEERVARGAEPIEQPVRQTWASVEAEAEALLKANPHAGYHLIEQLKREPRALSARDNALLLQHKALVMTEWQNASKRVNESAPDSEENKNAKADYDTLTEKFNEVDVFSRKAGTESGRSLAARKMMRDAEVSEEWLLQRFRTEVNLGKPLNDEQKAVVKKHAARIKRAQKATDELDDEAQAKLAERALQRLAADMAKAGSGKREGVRALVKDKAKAARKRIKAAMGLSAPPTGNASDAAYLEAVERGDMETAQRMVDEAAKAAGYTPVTQFHGTTKKFTEFGKEGTDWRGRMFFVTPDEEWARSEYASGSDPLKLYLKGGQYFDVANTEHRVRLQKALISSGLQANEAADIGLRLLQASRGIENKNLWATFESPVKDGKSVRFPVAEALSKAGFDAFKSTEEGHETIGVLGKPEFLKLSNPVTRDEQGNVIPLSQRFNPESKSILYSPAPSTISDADLAAVGAELIADGITSASALAEAIEKEFGIKLGQDASRVFLAAKREYDRDVAEFERANQPKALIAAAKDSEGGVNLSLLTSLAKSYIRQGVKDAEELTAKITADLQALKPGITQSEVNRLLSGYGKTSQPSKDEVQRQLTEIKSQLRLLSGIEDVGEGKPPLKSGFQRGKPSQRVRELATKLRDDMRKAGIETSGEEQLASARKAVVNRLTNQIADLNAIIAGKGKRRTDQSAIEYDAEMNALLKERNELKAYVDDLTGPNAELKWNRKAQAAAKASEEYYKRRIATADFESRKLPGQTENADTRKAREEAKKAKDEFNRLRDATGIPQAEQLASIKTQLEKEIEKVRQRLITGQNPQAPASQKPSDAETIALKETLARLRESVKLVEGTKEQTEEQRAQAAAKAVQKSIERLEQRIKDGGTNSRPRVPIAGTMTEAEMRESNEKWENDPMRELVQRRDFLKEQLEALQEAQNPTRLPEEIALSNFRRHIERKRQELQHGQKAEKYLEAPSPDPLFQSRRDRAKFELSQAREAWITELLNARLAARTPIKKVLGGIAEALNLSRSILTSLDLSAVIRQGGFIGFGHPILALKSVGPMFKAFYSKQNEFKAMEEIKARKNFPFYSQSKLYLTDMDEMDLAKMEENYMSRFATKIPLVAGSQRAYVTFLNKLRADTFDLLVETLGRDGRVTEAEGKAIASFINVATGRGIIGSADKPQGTPVLSTVFFSPRLMASRFNLLMGQPLYGGNARTRTLVAQQYGRFLVGIGASLALLSLFKDPDDDEPLLELDPRSADFLKARFGNTRLDLFGGLLQATVLMSRLISGQTKKRGKVEDIRGPNKPYSGDSTMDVLAKFIRSKLSPAIGTVVNLAQGQDFAGEPVTPVGEAIKMTVPMSLTNIKDVMEDQGVPRGAAMTLLSLFGAGLQTYDSGSTILVDPPALEELAKNWSAANPEDKWTPGDLTGADYVSKAQDPQTKKPVETKLEDPLQKKAFDVMLKSLRDEQFKARIPEGQVKKPTAQALKAVQSIRTDTKKQVQVAMGKPDWPQRVVEVVRRSDAQAAQKWQRKLKDVSVKQPAQSPAPPSPVPSASWSENPMERLKAMQRERALR